MPVAPTDAMAVLRKRDGGWGVFATCPLAAGEIVISDWHEAFCDGLTGWRAFTLTELEALPKENRELVLRYGLDADFDLIVGPVEEAAVTSVDNFINHSCEPALGYDVQGNVVTARRIDAGEELTIDYGCFAVNIDEPWECHCGSAKCRKRIRRDDWIQLAADRRFAMPRFLHARIAEHLGIR